MYQPLLKREQLKEVAQKLNPRIPNPVFLPINKYANTTALLLPFFYLSTSSERDPIEISHSQALKAATFIPESSQHLVGDIVHD